MNIVIFKAANGWHATLYIDGQPEWTSQPERRAGCAARAGMNRVQQLYGEPATDNFVIDLGEW